MQNGSTKPPGFLPDFYRHRRVVLCGGLGFIGSNLAIELVDLGAEVTIVDALLPAYGARTASIAPVVDRLHFALADLRDAPATQRLLRNAEVVFSLAGQMSHLSSMEDPQTDLDINCRTHLTLLEACRRVCPDAKIVLAGTRQVYGRPQRLPVDESHPTGPVDINGIHKLAAEQYYALYQRIYGLRTSWLRLTNTYGPRMDLHSPNKGFAAVLLRKALLGERLQLFGSGQQRRDFTYVDDVVSAHLLAGADDRALGPFNLGYPQPHSLLDYADILRQLTGCTYEIVPFPPEQEAIDIGDYWGDFSRFHQLTGWQPSVDLVTGLRRTIEFFRAHSREYGLPS